MKYFIVISSKAPVLFMENVNFKEVLKNHFTHKSVLDFIDSVVNDSAMECMTSKTEYISSYGGNVTVWKMDDTVISIPVYSTIFFLLIDGKPSNTYGNYASYVLRCFGEDYGLEYPSSLERLYDDACDSRNGCSEKEVDFSQGGSVTVNGIAIRESDMYF